jgi:hypothetical protein
LSLPHTLSTTFPSQLTQFMSICTSFPRVLEFRRLLRHGKAAQSASVRPAALQGRVLEGACDGGWVFDKDGETRTSRWTS